MTSCKVVKFSACRVWHVLKCLSFSQINYNIITYVWTISILMIWGWTKKNLLESGTRTNDLHINVPEVIGLSPTLVNLSLFGPKSFKFYPLGYPCGLQHFLYSYMYLLDHSSKAELEISLHDIHFSSWLVFFQRTMTKRSSDPIAAMHRLGSKIKGVFRSSNGKFKSIQQK